MMEHAAALGVAIDLVHLPSRTRVMRTAPLPDGVPLLLRIAAGDEGAISQAIEWTGRSHEIVREAAAFFIEQILLSPDADSYRVLGASPEATAGELRRNMALLLRWLHPDLDRDGERSIFAARVTLAWDDLKTLERRAAYDRSRGKLLAKKSLNRKKRSARTHPAKHASSNQLSFGAHDARHVGRAQLLDVPADAPRSLLHRALLFLLGRPKYR